MTVGFFPGRNDNLIGLRLSAEWCRGAWRELEKCGLTRWLNSDWISRPGPRRGVSGAPVGKTLAVTCIWLKSPGLCIPFWIPLCIPSCIPYCIPLCIPFRISICIPLCISLICIPLCLDCFFAMLPLDTEVGPFEGLPTYTFACQYRKPRMIVLNILISF